jgi:hypothetical protein
MRQMLLLPILIASIKVDRSKDYYDLQASQCCLLAGSPSPIVLVCCGGCRNSIKDGQPYFFTSNINSSVRWKAKKLFVRDEIEQGLSARPLRTAKPSILSILAS